MNKSFKVHLFFTSESQLGKLKEFNNEGRRYRSRELLKATLFCHQKNNEKADRLCMKFSSTSNTSVQQVHQLQISKSMLHYSVAPSLSKNISTNRVGSMKWKMNSFNYTFGPSGLNPSIHLLWLLQTP